MTRWKGTRETRLRLQRPGIRLSLLYSLSPRAPLWPPDPPLQAALLIMFVPVEFHKCCPPCPMVKKKHKTSGSPEGLGGGPMTRQCWVKSAVEQKINSRE